MKKGGKIIKREEGRKKVRRKEGGSEGTRWDGGRDREKEGGRKRRREGKREGEQLLLTCWRSFVKFLLPFLKLSFSFLLFFRRTEPT